MFDLFIRFETDERRLLCSLLGGNFGTSTMHSIEMWTHLPLSLHCEEDQKQMAGSVHFVWIFGMSALQAND
jgi:hypothetical protein